MENKDKFKIWTKKDGIVMVKIWETKWDKKGAERFTKAMSEVLDKIEGKAKILGDATNAKFGPTSKARKIYTGFLKSSKIGKAAVFGLTPRNRIIVSFMLTASQKKDFKVFSTKKEALKWLKFKSKLLTNLQK